MSQYSFDNRWWRPKTAATTGSSRWWRPRTAATTGYLLAPLRGADPEAGSRRGAAPPFGSFGSPPFPVYGRGGQGGEVLIQVGTGK